jgi:hypothetical protein
VNRESGSDKNMRGGEQEGSLGYLGGSEEGE